MSNEGEPDRVIEVEAPIDYEFIKSEIANKGPIRFSKPHLPIETILNIKPCRCLNNDCTNDVIHVERKCGLSIITWLIEPEELQEFDSLHAFSEWVLQFGFANSRGERLIIEHAIERETGATYHYVDEMFCACSNCMAAVGPEVVWKKYC